METLQLSPANQTLLANKQKDNNELKNNIIVQKNSKDTFTKTAKLTSCGVVAGGFIGALKEKLMPKNIPDSITAQYEDYTNPHGAHMAKKTDEMYSKCASTLKNAVNKILDGQELSKEEVCFIDKLGLITQDDIKYLSNSEFVKKYIAQIIKNDSSNANAYFAILDVGYWTSGLHGSSLYAGVNDRLEDILQDTGKYQDNEIFLDYLNSRFFSNRTYKIITDSKTGETRYAISDYCNDALKENEIVSQASYNFKGIINHAKENKKCSADIMEIFTDEGLHACKNNTPICKLASSISEMATKELKDEARQLKEAAIKNFKNKQLLKSAGIGAGLVGVIALLTALILNIKNKKKDN